MKEDMKDIENNGLVFDGNGSIKSWKVTYEAWFTDKTLLNKDEPYSVAYISAQSAREAASKLKKMLKLKCKICCEPELVLVSRDEYENS